MKINKLFLALVLGMGFSGLASAQGASGHLNIGGQVTGYTGTIGGNAGSSATSSAQVATEVIGTGASKQFQANTTKSGANIGGTIGANGVSVATDSFGTTKSISNGRVSGDAPLISADGSQSILNGGASFGDAESTAGGTSSFNKTAVGAKLAIHGAAGFQSF